MRLSTLRVSAAAVAALLGASLVACSSEDSAAEQSNSFEQSGATVQNCGRDVTVERPIERAIAVNQPAAEMLFALGVQDRMAGYAMSDDDVLPELREARGQVQAFDTEFPSFESVLEREPDMVYTTFNYTFTSEGIADRTKFTDLGVATYQSPSECTGQDAEQNKALTLDDLYDEIGDVATLFDVKDKGAELTESLKDRAATATASLGAENVTLAWWYAATKTPYFAGCCGAPGIMTDAVGAKNAFDDNKQYWPEIGWESVLDRDPTVLVLADLDRGGDGDSAAAKIAFLESDPVASKLTAVKNKRYIILEGTTMDPSIRNVGGIEQLSDGLRRLGVV
ncbi:ABC transporter substrate-binding protein [Rhodococcus erythropolis]|jgi:iron complex transport system substrate-binding protein|uniref:ABC transporter substrate-binding protein n=1 Tax=Rhodococcus TaxID=1827 RepID=UPI0014209989|nr:ABC transporter substrate-binding protein [uncultured Rhodococcus sp.]NHP17610.1 ABC transporter substrate-binding protein [Rhodococcus sp. IC4_135]